MNRSKNRRIYHKDANTLNFNIFPKIKKNIYITKCFRENKYNDYAKEVLLPYLQSTLGPKISVGDINQDGLEDVYIGGPAGTAGGLYQQIANGQFKRLNGDWEKDRAGST